MQTGTDREGTARLEPVPTQNKQGMFGAQGIWCHRERNQESGTNGAWYPMN